MIISVLLSMLLSVSAYSKNLVLPSEIRDEGEIQRVAITELAKSSLAAYVASTPKVNLNTLLNLQLAAQQYEDASSILKQIKKKNIDDSQIEELPLRIVAQAKLLSHQSNLTEEQAFSASFRDIFAALDNVDASKVINYFHNDRFTPHEALRSVLNTHAGQSSISLSDAIILIKHYQESKGAELWQPIISSLISEDDSKRYIIDDKVLIKTPDGAHISAILVRSKTAKKALPALLNFTIYVNKNKDLGRARASAAHGYVGMVAYTRGKAYSPQTPVPYEYDGQDANTVIDWLSKQTWVDGRVGMFGGSYDGFTQWAAAKYTHPALKTIVPYVANNPGNGLPVENNIFLLVNYAWAFYTTNNKTLDKEIYADRERWGSLNDKWFKSGKAYRQVDSIDGLPNKWYQKWLMHPSYDEYWRNMLPYKDEFSKINIPVLTITGYYDDGQKSAINFLRDHYKYKPNAEHYLLIGPYDHFGAQASKKSESLRGYKIDPVAQFDTAEVTYQWMDHVFYGADKPDLVKDKINYQVMGANKWKHAPSLSALSTETLTLYLSNQKVNDKYELVSEKPDDKVFLTQEVNFADRTTTNNDYYPYPIIGKKPDIASGYTFISKPFEESVEVSGNFSGEIKASINKRDMDVGVVLYEVMPDGQLFHLSYYLGRASFAKDITNRVLLTPGKVESIAFNRTRFISKKLRKGSRLMVTLNVNKNPYAQINYGTGKDVSDENISDAKTPLEVKWYINSFINVPIVR
ncbi:CocE/NonD family hydrolase [Pseudoalteromonas galatheae]|uniref:CocE/NonD family hydrolase n=1 Tax=Pseudoalteromonas galatheae TaxID=579562 RepID=UPI002E2B9693|nr:CocE/NonD family hydrolase [Pseudoalteromonas galatheae]